MVIKDEAPDRSASRLDRLRIRPVLCRMDTKNGGSILRHSGGLHPEFVPLGFLVEEPIHGYELYRRFGDALSGLWRLSESQMYATLKRLEERGLITGAAPEKGSAASRRVLSPTSVGQVMFATWLEEPSVCSPRVLRLEFLTRLFFARRIDPSSVPILLAAQRGAVHEALEQLGSQRSVPVPGFDVADSALAFSENQLRGAIAWLDTSVRSMIEKG